MRLLLFLTKNLKNRPLRLISWELSKKPRKLPIRRKSLRSGKSLSRRLPRELVVESMIKIRLRSKDSATSSEKFRQEFLKFSLRRMTTRHTPRFSQKLTISWMRPLLRSSRSKKDSREDSTTSKMEREICRESPTLGTRKSTETRQEFQEKPMMSTTPSRTVYSLKISSSNEQS